MASRTSLLRPFFFGALPEPAGGGLTGSGSLGGVCGPGAFAPMPGASKEALGGTTGMPLVTVCPETLSWRG